MLIESEKNVSVPYYRIRKKILDYYIKVIVE